MSNLKGILFNQFANEGLSLLVKEMQSKYKPKKGRRFNHNNITYEIGRPTLKEDHLQFELSSKIPQDEILNQKEMTSYFNDIKKILSKEKDPPLSVEMENIVWDSKKDREKERDYVKVIYSYPLDDLYDNKEVMKRYESINAGGKEKKDLPEVPSVYTTPGKLVLTLIRENMQGFAREHVNTLIQANKKVRDK